MNAEEDQKLVPKKRTKKFWNNLDTKVLKDLIEARTDLEVICEALERTPKAIRRRCDKLKISSATLYESRKKDIDNVKRLS